MIRLPKKTAQVTIEFTFCFILILLILFGCLGAFRWAGVSLMERRIAHDTTLNADVVNEGANWIEHPELSPLSQLDENFYEVKNMNMIFKNW